MNANNAAAGTENEELVSVEIGPIEIRSSRGIEARIKGIEINFLSGKEASETVTDVLQSLAPFDALTGEALNKKD